MFVRSGVGDGWPCGRTPAPPLPAAVAAGVVPNSVWTAPALQHLYLEGNVLGGGLSPSGNYSPSLRILWAGSNQFQVRAHSLLRLRACAHVGGALRFAGVRHGGVCVGGALIHRCRRQRAPPPPLPTPCCRHPAAPVCVLPRLLYCGCTSAAAVIYFIFPLTTTRCRRVCSPQLP
jgi:hypothetical protein